MEAICQPAQVERVASYELVLRGLEPRAGQPAGSATSLCLKDREPCVSMGMHCAFLFCFVFLNWFIFWVFWNNIVLNTQSLHIYEYIICTYTPSYCICVCVYVYIQSVITYMCVYICSKAPHKFSMCKQDCIQHWVTYNKVVLKLKCTGKSPSWGLGKAAGAGGLGVCIPKACPGDARTVLWPSAG